MNLRGVECRALNNMDLELHEAGRQLLLKRYNDQQAQGMLEILPSLLPHEYNKINPPDPPNLRPHLKQGAVLLLYPAFASGFQCQRLPCVICWPKVLQDRRVKPVLIVMEMTLRV